MSTSDDIITTSNGLGYTSSSAVHPEQLVKPPAAPSAREDTIEIKIDFGGGLHLLFSSQPSHKIRIPRNIPAEDGSTQAQPVNMRYLVKWMKSNLLSEREEMFGDGDGVRPGILVLINDADWELEGELEYELRDRDEVVFISTLHGG
ncbi:uncharacterized protein I303_104796 [Kwoniella dejecticola CBS 10117]|uniref:Ubiquitin-related modifier 1 n=1 Tax=Kwoniella dejecticola CBS 10117 TaxID=1296121 RepID=A0A1A6A4B7_9TREE|nr:uncharacterized protein I303_04223 [Kwoniella dejecticola CBS 10117]OBR84901.1 hypothetical protein I303_04223 [Kwoniella dejecticola CBS 10117]